MSSDLRSEDILVRIKEKLNSNKIKLWLDPYYDETKGIGEDQEQALELLSEEIIQHLNIDKEQCLSALRDLQNHALDRLKTNQVFKETGIACLKVKISGKTPRIITVNILLSESTSKLIEEVAKEITLPSERVKLIYQGRVLNPLEPLSAQGVRNSLPLMAVILADNTKSQESEKRFKTLESTKKDVELLAGKSNINNEYYMQIENQSGEALNLPYHERKSLVTAMTLHEKGRAALKKEDYSLALVLFLEADKEYSECTSQLLNSCDNYALLHLDISWCYLCLRNPAQIPDADKRLRLCEQSFHKSYGPNLERLMTIKGETGNEATLFMRLHLLQGVVLFHQNKRAEAKSLLERAQGELNDLKVDDNNLCLLLELGFTSSEARLGLRATHNNVELAEELIHRKRKEKELIRERNRLKLKNERERIKLGLCADGKQMVEPTLLQQLLNMGFDREQSLAALRQANNSISEAVNLIQEQPHLLPSGSQPVSQESIAQIASLGFDQEIARQALEQFPNLAKAVKSLCDFSEAAGTSAANILPSSASALSFLEELSKKRKSVEEEEQKAFERVSEGLVGNDLTEDHLDLNLDQEEQFLMEYLSLLD